ncbi:hypothetical protein K0M31_015423 [Melipona bicolor]|uniref:Uncharacterized protein n=1 Tax=Melipona bicolor TaxID=60889 RepID=A0AA40FFN5_9HYME|nr:hypothetical protein K0M31_015423 [Melipona bicolor]
MASFYRNLQKNNLTCTLLAKKHPRTNKNANTVSSIERGRSVQPVAATAAKEENSIRQEDVNLANTSAMNQSAVAEGNSKTRRPVSWRQKPGGEEGPRNSEIDSLACNANETQRRSPAVVACNRTTQHRAHTRRGIRETVNPRETRGNGKR